MAKLTVVYFSGYGHTRRPAELITAGAASVAGALALSVAIDREGNLSNDTWVLLHSQDALIFGSPTYMAPPGSSKSSVMAAPNRGWPRVGG
jgi:flavodoxin